MIIIYLPVVKNTNAYNSARVGCSLQFVTILLTTGFQGTHYVVKVEAIFMMHCKHRESYFRFMLKPKNSNRMQSDPTQRLFYPTPHLSAFSASESFTFSLTCFYQKDERALAGNFLFLPLNVMSFTTSSQFSFSVIHSFPLAFLSSSFFFCFKELKKIRHVNYVLF